MPYFARLSSFLLSKSSYTIFYSVGTDNILEFFENIPP